MGEVVDFARNRAVRAAVRLGDAAIEFEDAESAFRAAVRTHGRDAVPKSVQDRHSAANAAFSESRKEYRKMRLSLKADGGG